MTTIANIPHFNAIEYVKRLRSVNFTQEQAEVQALEMEQVVSRIVIDIKAELKQELHANELATEKDLEMAKLELQKHIENNTVKLELKIEQYRYDSLKFIVWTGIGVVVVLGGMLAKGFHWW